MDYSRNWFFWHPYRTIGMTISKKGFSRQHGGLILDYLPSCRSSINFTEEPRNSNAE
jgi:hypothetical protein